MSMLHARLLVLFVTICLFSSCANIVPPSGGLKDIAPPKLLSVSPKDSSLNTRVTKIEIYFDEYVNINNTTTEVTVSPLLPFPLNVEANLKKVTVKIPDSLLHENTTYRISFGKSIQDVHENNPFKDYHYTFSTGKYFDSLKLSGKVITAATGKPDNSSIVVLYDAMCSDSCIVRQKPIYFTKTDTNGDFHFDGLPAKAMKIYALNDANTNLIFDPKNELIAFSDSTVYPMDAFALNISLKLFPVNDSVGKKKSDNGFGQRNTATSNTKSESKTFSYTVKVDTSDIHKRSQDLNIPIIIEANKPIAKWNNNRFSLFYDSLGVQVEAFAKMNVDTIRKNQLKIETDWKENLIYTLKLLKGFMQDSSNADALPSRSVFRTKRQEDYAKFQVHLPSKYFDNHFLLEVLHDDESFYLKPIKDTMVSLNMLPPGSYNIRVIVDKNENGKWDYGNLFKKIQPEDVIPYPEKILLKAGWENIVDFEDTKVKKH